MAKKPKATEPHITYRTRHGKKPGRPRAKINWKRVAEMCNAGCFSTSIALALGISTETLLARCKIDNGEDFTAFRQRHVAQGDDILRERQYKLAKAGNERLLIWLGKNRLGQKDKTEISGNTGAPLPVINVVVQAPMQDGASAEG